MNRNRKYVVHMKKVMGVMPIRLAVLVATGSVHAIAAVTDESGRASGPRRPRKQRPAPSTARSRMRP